MLETLEEREWDNAIGVVLGGEASVATNGFWSALTIATTLSLPMLFYIEDNGLGISVRGDMQTPGGDITRNLASFQNLFVRNGDGTDPAQTAALLTECVDHVRGGRGPALVRLTGASLVQPLGTRQSARLSHRGRDLVRHRARSSPSLAELPRAVAP
jgi:2-oxoisovalerate dehydrogenase E1 component